MSRQLSMGTCNLCGKSFSRASMTRHLDKCSPPEPPPSSSVPSKACFHLLIESHHAKAYWMHVAMPVETTLAKLDGFLREIWLECCGHLSGFTIDGRNYVSEAAKEFGDSGMGARLSRILQVGMTFSYEYDYGSTTELRMKVLAVRDQVPARGQVQLLARNDPPQVACEQCGDRPAVHICAECAWRGEGWLCETCIAGHKCGEGMYLPVVNSPRAGVCAYSG